MEPYCRPCDFTREIGFRLQWVKNNLGSCTNLFQKFSFRSFSTIPIRIVLASAAVEPSSNSNTFSHLHGFSQDRNRLIYNSKRYSNGTVYDDDERYEKQIPPPPPSPPSSSSSSSRNENAQKRVSGSSQTKSAPMRGKFVFQTKT